MPSRTTIAAGALVAVLLPAGCGGGIETAATLGEPTVSTQIEHGVWRAISEAPIGTRPYAVSGWSGSEALFWAGSNLERNFANTLGAAYDPASDSWRELPVPGWGHPGLSGTVFGGHFYAAAKGGVNRIDPSDGSAIQLPRVDGFIPATMVATDEAVWSLGPTDYSDHRPVRVGIARYDAEADMWVSGPIFEGAAEMGSLFHDLLFVEQPVLWTGSEILVWSHSGHGLAYDPAEELWQLLPSLIPPRGALSDSEVAAGDSGLVALAKINDGETVSFGVAAWDGESWDWHDIGVDFTDFEAVTIAAARDWLVAFSPDQPPYTIHVTTGDSMRHDGAPISGVQAPNVVWTGNQLVIWGGVPTRSDNNPNPPGGATWFAPGG